MVKGYPEFFQQVNTLMNDLAKEHPDVMSCFMQLHKASATDGALSGKFKELIALGIAISIRCDGCIAFHVHDAIEAGATQEEIVETIGVAIVMGGGPSVVYGSQALLALKEFDLEKMQLA